MAELVRVKGRYAGLKAYLKSLLSELNSYISSDECDQVKTLGFRSTVAGILDQLAVVHNEIILLIDPKDVEVEVIEHMKSLEPSYAILAAVDLKLQQFKTGSQIQTPIAINDYSNISPAQCKLPKIKLPEFAGDPLLWQGFWDQFKVSIHSKDNLSCIDKFNYLKGCLRGEALAAISGLTLNNENYEEAVQLLGERFGNEQILISAHMESLLKINKIRSPDNIKGLRMLYNHVESCVRNLRSLKLDTAGYGSLLIPILKDRLPDEIIMVIARKFGGNKWTLEQVMDYFNAELRAQENCAGVNTTRSSSFENQKKGGLFTASGLYTEARARACIYCNKDDHVPSKCTVVTSHQSRKAILLRKRRCFVCLDGGHVAKDCTSTYVCRRCKKGKHHISICRSVPLDPPVDTRKGRENEAKGESSKGFVGHASCDKKGILLQTARVDIAALDDDKPQVCTRILFDSGSQRSYISYKVRSSLKLKTVRSEKLIIKTFGEVHESEVQELDIVQFKIKNRYDSRFTNIEAVCVPTICTPLTKQSMPGLQDCREFKEIKFADYDDHESNRPVGILIGIDYYHTFMTGRVIRSSLGPVACDTKVGWVVSGSCSSPEDMYCLETHMLNAVTEQQGSYDLRQDIEKFWNVEDVGFSRDCVVSHFEENIVHNGTRYVTKLPFKPDHEPLSDNFVVSEQRLKALKSRLMVKGIFNDYNSIFSDYEEKRIIERVPLNEIAKESGRVHYLPHRPVIREDKDTTKMRAVFDASCKVNGPSLNECLYSGPNLIVKIFDILLRFRFNKIGILADIKQAFLNIAIDKEHCDYLRFLWYDDQSDEEHIVVYRFLRVVFGVTSSPFLLNGTIRHHFNKYLDRERNVVERVGEDLYVDDLVSGCKNREEGKELYDKIKAIMLEGGFNLRKWTTNDRKLNDYIVSRESEKVNSVTGSDDGTYFEIMSPNIDTRNKTVLGMEWDIERDEFVFRFDNLLQKCGSITQTKRNLLSVSASIFDPLGFVSPITAKIKTIFQMLCKDKLDWDEIIPQKIALIWNNFLEELNDLKEVKCSRFVFWDHFDSGVRVELHGFCDSSTEVYCAVVYLRLIYRGNVKVSFLASKTKVAPLKTLTIPRLELLGCLLLSKLIKEIITASSNRIKYDDVYCWSDSEIALAWIRGKEKCWELWVENRVVAIRKVVDRNRWNFVKGEHNPADIPTRVSSNLIECFSGSWFSGPLMLLSHNIESREQVINSNCINDKSLLGRVDVEYFPEVFETPLNVSMAQRNTKDRKTRSLSSVISCNRFSSLSKLIVTTGYVLRFINNLQKRIKKQGNLITDETLSVVEFNEALQSWIKEEQRLMKQQDNYNNIRSSLQLFESDDGLLRLRGRFANSNLQYQEQHPIILRNKDSHFTRLIILDEHEKTMHHGVETTLARIRFKYWIVKGRKSVKEVLRKCVLCTRYQGQPMRPPSSPDLPDYRVDHLAHAFQATGLDFAGPLFVKNSSKTEKSYILLLTCASSRAVHLELVPNMSVDGFLRGIKRFMARRGIPDFIVSDNFKTFKSAEVKKFMLLHGITQRFILPASPWWGGFYERLVRTVKTCLKKTLGRTFLSFEELQTILCETEVAINNRPLTYVSEDDLDEALTPFHLMHGRNPGKRIESVNFAFPTNMKQCKRRYFHVQKALKDFWVRFRGTYLNELRQMNLYRKSKNKNTRTITVGDVALIRDDVPLPRTQWRMGRILRLVSGSDRQVRGAQLKVLSKAGKHNSVSSITKAKPI